MRLATTEQMHEIDGLSMKVYGLTSDVLMEAAGTLAARELQLSYFPELGRGATSILCGPGNNGGDGLVVARHLHSQGFRNLTVYYLGRSSKQSEAFKLQLKRAELSGFRLVNLNRQMQKADAIKSSYLIIDALFGIGLSKAITGDYLTLIEKANSVKCPKVSLDIPSGLDGNCGQVLGAAIRADMTLTFGLAKPGFFVGEGPSHVGKLRTLSIGFPPEALRGVATTRFLFTEKLARRYLPKRGDTDNKSDHGRLMIVAGSEGTWGAGVLASHAAFRMGTGYVYWASHTSPLAELKSAPEVMVRDLGDPEIWQKGRFQAWVVGPGLGTGRATADLLIKLKAQRIERVLVDADALQVAVKEKLFPFPVSWVITPHSGELARILGVDAVEIEKDRFHAALEAAKKTGCFVLLKGYRSIVASGDRAMIINAGNSALAKAGTGDVLAGMIGALLAQGLDTLQATATGAFLHGRLADEWLRKGLHRSSLLASDIQQDLPGLLSRIATSVVF